MLSVILQIRPKLDNRVTLISEFTFEEGMIQSLVKVFLVFRFLAELHYTT